MYYIDKRASIFCEWGMSGIEALRDHVDVFVIVDVLSFSTCVDIAVSRGASVHPYPYKDESAEEYARSIGAVCAASRRSKTELSLSSYSLLSIEPGTKLVLPSPNGSHLSRSTGDKPTLCGSLRNAGATARAARSLGERMGVIPAGERWADDSIRFAIEDWLGAGAIIAALEGERTEEAAMAAQSFESSDLEQAMLSSVSGRELIDRGFPEDVELASQYNVSHIAPILVDSAFTAYRQAMV